MRLSDWRNTRLRLALVYVLAICSFQLYPLVSHAQNLGRSRHRRAKPYRVKPRPNPREPFSIS